MEKVEKLSHLEHVLKRPDSYVGPTNLSTESYWVLNGQKFEKKSTKYSPGLLKIFDEILVNAIDRNSLHPKNVTSIDGTIMLIAQAISSFNIWTGQSIKFNEAYKEILERIDHEN